MRILLDHNVPKGLGSLLTDHRVHTAYEMGWAELTNGRLLDAAEEGGFEVMITGDQNLAHQQRLAGRRLALVILSETGWPTVMANPEPIRGAVERAREGAYLVVSLPRLPLRRRPPPRRG
jgi:predicted nuclease of predicted toxin-antitoxin system